MLCFMDLRDIVGQQLDTALNAKKHATLAVPGGTTPAPFFERLRQNPLDWKNIRVTLTDERFVPETSDRSNTRLLRQTLFQDHAKHAQFIPLYAPADQPEDVLSTLRMGVTQVLPLDVCVLGMGTDMHTASLFPGADLLAEALADTAPTVLPMRAPNAPEPRMTLSAPVFARGRACASVDHGQRKERRFAKRNGSHRRNAGPCALYLGPSPRSLRRIRGPHGPLENTRCTARKPTRAVLFCNCLTIPRGLTSFPPVVVIS